MDRAQLKYRIVGALVLISLALIIVPLLLDRGPREVAEPVRLSFPEHPVIAGESPALPHGETGSTEWQETPPAAIVEQVRESLGDEVADPPEVPQGVDAWIVQAASFESEASAQDLLGRLRNADFPVFIETGRAGGKDIHRVRIGPVFAADEAAQFRERLGSQFKLDGLVMKFP